MNIGSSKKVEGGKEMSEQEWFKQVDKLKRQFGKINSEVQKALKSGKFRKMVSAMHRASDEMPELLRKLESLTPPKVEWEESWKYFIEGLTGYLLSCRYYERGLLEDDASAINHAIGHMEEAGKLLEKARKIVEF
jgi:hypothetical protein